MDDARDAESPLESVAGAAGEEAIEAFAALGNQTRLSILLALWEAFEPFEDEEPVLFTELRDRVGVRQGRQFNYHLNKLVGRFVEKREAGYELRRAGHQIVRAVIAGAGIDEPTTELVKISIDCPVCDAPTAVHYRGEWLYIVCTECEGLFEGEDRPHGMLGGTKFNPAGLANRNAEEQWRAGWLTAKSHIQLAIEGICGACSGPMERSLDVCADHADDGPCDRCGRGFAVHVRFQCPVCKNYHSVPPRTTVIHHPAVISFYHERGVEYQYDDGSFASVRRCVELISEHEQELVSTEPVRVRVTVRHEGDTLRLTLNDALDVVDIELS